MQHDIGVDILVLLENTREKLSTLLKVHNTISMKIMKNQQLAKLINKGWRFSFEIGHKKDWPHQCLLNFVEFFCIRNFE